MWTSTVALGRLTHESAVEIQRAAGEGLGQDARVTRIEIASPGDAAEVASQGIGASLVRHAERQAVRCRRRALLAEALCGGPGHHMLHHLGWREAGRHSGRLVAGAAWVDLVRELEDTPRAGNRAPGAR
jgi:hypothetical protein